MGSLFQNLATLLHPLNCLLQHGRTWSWSKDCEEAFKRAKVELISSRVLVHYDINLPIKVAADASAYGVGAVMSHVFPDGEERPIAFASRTLSASECNYAQVEKEALALVFGVRKFHTYLYSRRFTLTTSLLLQSLGPKRASHPWLQQDSSDGRCFCLPTCMTFNSNQHSSMEM